MDVAAFFNYAFQGVITYHDVGSTRYQYTVVMLPGELAAELPLKKYPRLRITGEANDIPFDAALTPFPGGWYILFSKKMLKVMEAGVGDEVALRFSIADQNAVDIPPALDQLLNQDNELFRQWQAQTPGNQRGLAYRVATAKTEKTISRRLEEVAAILRGERALRPPKKAKIPAESAHGEANR